MRKKKYALVLSGGGFKGAFQLGALKRLRDNWHLIDPEGAEMRFDIIAGISVGALNGVMVAMDKLEELEEIWRLVAENGPEEIYKSNFIDTSSKSDKVEFKIKYGEVAKQLIETPSIWEAFSMLLSKRARQRRLEKALESLNGFKSLADNAPLREKLERYLDLGQVQSREFLCGAVDLNEGLYRGMSHRDFMSNDDFVKGVLASTVIPLVWDPVEEICLRHSVTLRNIVDGGIRSSSPIADVLKAIDRDPEADHSDYVLVIINCNNGLIEEEDFAGANILKIAARSLTEITLSEIFNNDLDLFFRVNGLVKQAEAAGLQLYKENQPHSTAGRQPFRAYASILIQPEGNALGNMLVATPDRIASRMEHGDAMAEEALEAFLQEDMEPIEA